MLVSGTKEFVARDCSGQAQLRHCPEDRSITIGELVVSTECALDVANEVLDCLPVSHARILGEPSQVPHSASNVRASGHC